MNLPQPRATQHSPRVVLLSVKKPHHNHNHNHTTTPGSLDFFWFLTSTSPPMQKNILNTILNHHTTPGSLDFALVFYFYITTKGKKNHDTSSKTTTTPHPPGSFEFVSVFFPSILAQHKKRKTTTKMEMVGDQLNENERQPKKSKLKMTKKK